MLGGDGLGARTPLIHLQVVEAIERASLLGWPASVVEECADGWVLRATPGLDRGRSCHALTPRDRSLTAEEWSVALERVRAFSAAHGIRGGVQIAPLEVHAPAAVDRLVAAGWSPSWKVWVMRADRGAVLAGGRGPGRTRDPATADALLIPWHVESEATPEWLTNWELCEPRVDRAMIDAHARTAFAHMDGRGRFGRLGHVASGIAVEDPGGEYAGLFSLVVRDGLRGRGLGRRLVVALVEAVSAPVIYLQVTVDNEVALGLYRSLGFTATHSYQHLIAPVGWAGGRVSSTAGPGRAARRS